MAKKSKIVKEAKKLATALRYRDIIQKLKEKGDYIGLQKLPRNASMTRVRNRDSIDGRARGYIRKFGLSRIHFRELVHKGQIPGVKKASW